MQQQQSKGRQRGGLCHVVAFAVVPTDKGGRNNEPSAMLEKLKIFRYKWKKKSLCIETALIQSIFVCKFFCTSGGIILGYARIMV